MARRIAADAAPSAPVAVLVPHAAAALTAVERATIAIAVVAVVAAAAAAESFLVPVVLGILVAYTLRPVVRALQRLHVPLPVGATLVIVTLLVALGTTTWMLRDDVSAAIAELPGAARKLRQIAAESARDSNSSITHVKAAAAELDRAAAEATGKAGVTPAPASTNGGVAAQVQGFVATQSSKVLLVIGQVLVAILLAFFLLIAGDKFRRKVTHLAGATLARRRITVEALNEIDSQIQRYMLTLLVSNVLIALAVWGGLALIGTSNAGLWGIVVGVLHVVPYAGTFIAAAVVGVATLLDVGTVSSAVAAMTMIVAVAMVIGVGFTTWLQGRASNINAVAAFVGVLFFGWLWGGWGLLLGMPMLAVLKSIADRVEAMHAVRELLSP